MANLRDSIAPAIDAEPQSKIVECESCSKRGPTHRMLQVIMGLSSTGHEDVAPVYCTAQQHPDISGHWACPTEDCYLDVLVACAKEHIIPQLHAGHARVWEKAAAANGNSTHQV